MVCAVSVDQVGQIPSNVQFQDAVSVLFCFSHRIVPDRCPVHLPQLCCEIIFFKKQIYFEIVFYYYATIKITGYTCNVLPNPCCTDCSSK